MRTDFDSLVGSIYEAALHPQQWSTALRGLRHLADSQGAALMFGGRGSAQVGIADGHSPESAVDYDQYYNALDPLVPFGFQRPPGTWCNDWRVAGPRYVRTEYYNDFFRKHGWHACTAAVLHMDRDFWACVSFQRTTNKLAFETSDEDRVGHVLPHLRRAFRLYWEAEALRRRADLSQSALDCVHMAVWIVDARAKVLLANRSAAQLAAERSSGIEERHGYLRPSQSDPSAFERALRLATLAKGAQASWIGLGRSDRRSLTVMPAPSAAVGGAARLAVLLIKTAEKPIQIVDALRSLYGLTPREAEVASLVGTGSKPKQVADALHLTTETVRTYLKMVYAKTGLRSQSELARSLGQMPGTTGSD